MDHAIPLNLQPTANTPPEASALPATSPLERGLRLLSAAAGYAALGAAGGFGSADFGFLACLRAPLLASAMGVAVTVPSLVIAHEWLEGKAPLASVISAPVEAWTRCGMLAFSLAPVVVFFAAASHVATAMYLLAVVGVAGVGLITGMASIGSLSAPPSGAGAGSAFLALSWAFLAGGISLVLFYRLLVAG